MTGLIVGISLQAIAWLGSLIWWISKSSSNTKAINEELSKVNDIIEGLKKADDALSESLDRAVRDRAEYNEHHYLSIERFNECNKSTQDALSKIDAINLGERLARMEGSLTSIKDLQSTLIEILVKKEK